MGAKLFPRPLPVTLVISPQLPPLATLAPELELATRLKVGPPVFSVEPAVSGFVGKASLPLRNEPALVSGAYAARLAKTAEQAAAADLLKALHAWTVSVRRLPWKIRPRALRRPRLLRRSRTRREGCAARTRACSSTRCASSGS